MKELKKSLLYTYGIADMFFVLMVSMELYYFTMFLTDWAQFSMKTVQVILYITGALDIACVLLSGIILEKINLKFGGKYRSWFLIGPPPIAILFIFQFTKIGSDVIAATIIIIGFVASHLLWNTVAACGGAMIGRMSRQTRELTLLSTNRAQGMTAAGLIFSFAGPWMIAFFSERTNQITGASITVAVVGVLMVLGYLYIYRATSGMDPYDTETSRAAQKETALSIREIISLVFCNRPLLMLIVAEIFRNSSILLVAAMAAYYCKYVLNNEPFMQPFLLITAIFGVAGSFIAAWIGPRLGKRHTYWITMAAAGVIYVLARFLGTTDWKFTILFGFGAMFIAIASCMCTALFSDTVVYGEWKNGKNIRAFTMALLNLPIKLGVLLRSAVVTLGLTVIGYVANAEPTQEVVSGIASLITFSNAAVCLLAAVIFFLGYKLKDEDITKMQEELTAIKESGIPG
ncbi:MAG: MFS transporter [Acidobacteria bacterium]|nr:MFS transporter [Acidobacteriota bacterium]